MISKTILAQGVISYAMRFDSQRERVKRDPTDRRMELARL
jgi:hypothetical protein